MIEHTLIVDPITQEISSGPNLPRKTFKCETISFKSLAHGGRHVVAMLSYGQDVNKLSAFFDILDYTMEAPIWENLEARVDKGQKFELIRPIDGSDSQLLQAPSGDGFIAL